MVLLYAFWYTHTSGLRIRLFGSWMSQYFLITLLKDYFVLRDFYFVMFRSRRNAVRIPEARLTEAMQGRTQTQAWKGLTDATLTDAGHTQVTAQGRSTAQDVVAL